MRTHLGCLDRLGAKGPDRIPALSAAFHDPNDYVRYWFMYQAARHKAGSRTGLRRLLADALLHRDADIRGRAAEVLGEVGGQLVDPLPLAEKALRDSNPSIREVGVRVLGRVANKATIPGLIRALHDADPVVRGRASIALSHLSCTAVPPLTEALKEKDEGVRASAITALGRIGRTAKPAVPTLVDLVKHGEPYMRKLAGLALKKIDPQAAAKAGAN